MKTTTNKLLNVMHVISWLVFIGLCINVGALLISFATSLFINPEGANNIYLGLNLFDLKEFSNLHFVMIILLLILIEGLKALMLYKVVSIFSNIDLVSPFSQKASKLIAQISYLAFSIGLSLAIAIYYESWLKIEKNIDLPTLQEYIDGGKEFLFFAGIIYVISLVFRRGVEYQDELEETV
ncbi:DUF2975 domain-containing protein [Pontimicrobium sp. SW4]|uniref:DUF2975 domain-containing protein n=1 Tax=Pontimicrobium sp. SW4 TaxID=3153519 RepID=A0AAU7BNR9_9FLAO